MLCNNCKTETHYLKVNIKNFSFSLCETCFKTFITKYIFVLNLVKMQIPKEEKQKFDLFLNELTK